MNAKVDGQRLGRLSTDAPGNDVWTVIVGRGQLSPDVPDRCPAEATAIVLHALSLLVHTEAKRRLLGSP